MEQESNQQIHGLGTALKGMLLQERVPERDDGVLGCVIFGERFPRWKTARDRTDIGQTSFWVIQNVRSGERRHGSYLRRARKGPF